MVLVHPRRRWSWRCAPQQRKSPSSPTSRACPSPALMPIVEPLAASRTPSRAHGCRLSLTHSGTRGVGRKKMNSANADERRGELSLACILALDVQLVRATITRGSGPICSRVGAPPRMSSMPQPHLVRCVIRDTPARRARLHDPRVPTAGDLLVTTPTNTDRTPYTCTLVLPCRPSRPEPALLLPQARQPRHTAPWRVPRVHTHNSHTHTH